MFQITHELADKSNTLQRRQKVITGRFGSDSFLGSLREYSVKVLSQLQLKVSWDLHQLLSKRYGINARGVIEIQFLMCLL